jgi:hypothetical protein
MIEKDYLPFTEEELKQHFLPIEKFDNFYKDYDKSAKRYKEIRGNGEGASHSLRESRLPRQIEKDERFWTITALKKILDAGLFDRLMAAGFGEHPPLPGDISWREYLSDILRLFFEVQLSTPQVYLNWMNEHFSRQHFIPYVLEAAESRRRRGLERASQADALLVNQNNGFSVLFEAKVLSDLSVHTSYNVTRNQLARLVDVMLEQPRSDAHFPLNNRDPQKTLLVLVTPRIFKTHCQSRLYGWLFDDYRNNDLPHRQGVNWLAVSQRLAWITWEDCERILPGACPWLHKKAAEASTMT